VRYTTRDQWHITLRFLGDAEIANAITALSRVHARVAEAALGPRVERLGRTVAMVPCAGLDEIAASALRATADIDHPIDARPFLGHLTIARMKNARRCPATGFAIAANFAVTEVHLVRSRLASTGARYEIVATRALEVS
jgi:2'-5' RNA ligase